MIREAAKKFYFLSGTAFKQNVKNFIKKIIMHLGCIGKTAKKEIFISGQTTKALTPPPRA